MELKDLVGQHVLDAVDFSTESLPAYEGADYTEDSQVCRFRLDGVVYAVMEDPSDGYRSSMKDIVLAPDAVLQNIFAAAAVVGVYKERRDHGECDILEFIDSTTGKIVLEIGTKNTNKYYPYFVASFHPENMAINATPEPPKPVPPPKDPMQVMAKAIDTALNGGTLPLRFHGFALLVFPFDDENETMVNYVSNANHNDMVTALKALVARFEGQPKQEGHG